MNGTMSRSRRRSLRHPPRLVLRPLPQSRYLRCLILSVMDIMPHRRGCIPMHSKCRTQCPTFHFLGIPCRASLFPKSSQVFQGLIPVAQLEPFRPLGLPQCMVCVPPFASLTPLDLTSNPKSYIPYPTQQATQPASAANMESQQLNSRAPLAPTGFIQNEHGTLIAVYQPEALDRYMAGSNRVPPAVPQHPIQANWPSFPPSHSYPFPAVPPPLSSRPIPSSSDIGWSANPGFASLQGPHHIPPHLNPPGPIPAVGFRGAYNDMTGQVGGPGYRRPALRRDQGHTSNHVRPYQPRSFPGRHARGNMSNAGYGEAHLRTPQNSNDWSHWSAGR